MAPSIPGKTLSKLGLCLLLIGNMLLWSASWNAPALHGGQFEQLGDCSPPFLVGTGDGSPDENTCADSARTKFETGLVSASTVATVRGVAGARIRISSYPILPQAPPAFT